MFPIPRIFFICESYYLSVGDKDPQLASLHGWMTALYSFCRAVPSLLTPHVTVIRLAMTNLRKVKYDRTQLDCCYDENLFVLWSIH